MGRGAEDRTLADRVYDDVLAKIVDGTFGVGSKLPTETKLSDVFGVSRPVLRQALRQLKEDGVIVTRQGSGSFVQRRPEGAVMDFAPVASIADIQRTFEFRAAVEGEAAYCAAQRRSEADLVRMKAALDTLDRTVREGCFAVDADEAFHEAICQAADNPYFVAARLSMKSNIMTGMDLMRNLSLSSTRDRWELVQKEHYAIYNSIDELHPERAKEAMRAHIENARKRVFDGVKG